jgi:hypothetical protein
MKFIKQVSAATATALVDRIVGVALSAGQDWDGVQFLLPDGTESWAHNEHDRPAAWHSVTGHAMSSRVTVSCTDGEWRVGFEGMRGSLRQHWGSELIKLLASDPGQMLEYETSIPGMLPWEGLGDWFTRLTGEEDLHPFYPLEHPQPNADFNRRFHSAMKLLEKKRKLNATEIVLWRNTIVADIKRKYGWA